MSQQILAGIDANLRATSEITGISSLSPRVRAAIASVDRSEFVPAATVARSDGDFPLPIGCGQTISQPFIVALMTELIQPEPHHRVLDIGTGSGYQAAVLAQLVSEVFSVEIIKALADGARQRLQALGYSGINVRCADAYEGWQEQAPFDGMVVAAAIDEVPDKLLEQLSEGGRLVLPLGKPGGSQQLTVLEKQSGTICQREVLPVRFVPFTRHQ